MTYDPEKFTPTERRILDILADGQGHTKYELFNALDDQLAGRTAMRFHVCNIRAKLEPLGETIVCEFRNVFKYRHVRLVNHISK